MQPNSISNINSQPSIKEEQAKPVENSKNSRIKEIALTSFAFLAADLMLVGAGMVMGVPLTPILTLLAASVGVYALTIFILLSSRNAPQSISQPASQPQFEYSSVSHSSELPPPEALLSAVVPSSALPSPETLLSVVRASSVVASYSQPSLGAEAAPPLAAPVAAPASAGVINHILLHSESEVKVRGGDAILKKESEAKINRAYLPTVALKEASQISAHCVKYQARLGLAIRSADLQELRHEIEEAQRFAALMPEASRSLSALLELQEFIKMAQQMEGWVAGAEKSYQELKNSLKSGELLGIRKFAAALKDHLEALPVPLKTLSPETKACFYDQALWIEALQKQVMMAMEARQSLHSAKNLINGIQSAKNSAESEDYINKAIDKLVEAEEQLESLTEDFQKCIPQLYAQVKSTYTQLESAQTLFQNLQTQSQIKEGISKRFASEHIDSDEDLSDADDDAGDMNSSTPSSTSDSDSSRSVDEPHDPKVMGPSLEELMRKLQGSPLNIHQPKKIDLQAVSPGPVFKIN